MIGEQHAARRDLFRWLAQAHKQEGEWWIGWIEEVPGVNCQEHTREALIDSLRATLTEALEMNRAEAKQAAGRNYEELTIAV